jgi:hypothetical protein
MRTASVDLAGASDSGARHMTPELPEPTQADIMDLLALVRPHSPACGNVRIGRDGDGGYVVPDLLDGLEGVLSFGIGHEVSFDEWFAQRGVPVFQYDHTVEGPPIEHPNFRFHKLAWGPDDTLEARSLAGTLRENGLESSMELLLKFDVEGDEWVALADIDEDLLGRFRIITAEFHGFDRLVESAHFARTRSVIERISRTHVSTHVHANNCCGVELVCGVPLARLMEITFVRRGDVDFTPDTSTIPGPLDHPNIAGRDDIVLTPWGIAEPPNAGSPGASHRTVPERTAAAREATRADDRSAIAERDALLASCGSLAAQLAEQARLHAQAADAREETEAQLMAVVGSRSWRWTSWLRSGHH